MTNAKNDAVLPPVDAKSEALLHKLVTDASNSDYAMPIAGKAPAPYVQRKIGQHTLHILGGQFGTLGAVDVIHTQIISKLNADPSSWLMLFEGASENLEYLVAEGMKQTGEAPLHVALYAPDLHYYQEVANMYGIPAEEALPDLESRAVRKYIASETGLSRRIVKRTWNGLVRRALPMPDEVEVTPVPEDAPAEIRQREADTPLEIQHIFEAMGEQDPILTISPEESAVMEAVGRYVFTNYLPTILNRHPTKKNVLMIIGINNHIALDNYLRNVDPTATDSDGTMTIFE